MTDRARPAQLPRYIAIDGLRAWMAWVVVISHVAQQGLTAAGLGPLLLLDPGGQAVDVFIIISGFVITHLLIERPGPYISYIIPRFMRLFPAFLVCCALGQITYMIAARIGTPAWFEPLHGSGYRALLDHYPSHVLAHLTMLHGALPNNILPQSQYAFLPPGWSVSLEWQFYLIAPAIIWLAQSRNRAILLVIAVIVCGVCYHEALKPLWERPSFIAAAAKMFLIGIGCRFAAPALAGTVNYVAAIGIGIGFTVLWIGSASVAVWLVIYAFILRSDAPRSGVDAAYERTAKALLESAPAQFLAERSYSTYLLHWPILTMIGAVATSRGVLPGWHLVGLMLLAVPLTLLLQEPLYRYVEVPGRAIGKRLTVRYGTRPTVEKTAEFFTTADRVSECKHRTDGSEH
jgi:peptidoglycan/LPS O-acetylase OafA/YrhL